MLGPLVAATLAASAGEAQVAALEQFHQELFERLAPAVVFIASGDGLGSGLLVDKGLVLTNRHVPGDARTVQVVLHDGRKAKGTVVEYAEGEVDLALIRLDLTDTPAAPLALTHELRVGSWVAAVGHGVGSVWTFNVGSVSNMYGARSARPVFQTQIPLNPGNSGGPIVDRQGRVVGIVTAGVKGANSINFGIDVTVAANSLPGLRKALGSLLLRAPAGVPVFLGGRAVGKGPSVTVPAVTAPTEAFVVVNGKMVRGQVLPGQRELALAVDPPDAGAAAQVAPGPPRRPLGR